ncbi:MAG: hypothetical protein H7834_14175 [Magnetococcus sp. YQC-9]
MREDAFPFRGGDIDESLQFFQCVDVILELIAPFVHVVRTALGWMPGAGVMKVGSYGMIKCSLAYLYLMIDPFEREMNLFFVWIVGCAGKWS